MANINQMIADLDSQISSLQTARQALAEAHGVGSALQAGPRRGVRLAKVATGRVRRTMSPEARAKIAAAQKLRWAKVAGNQGDTKKNVAKRVAAPVKKAGGYRARAKKASAQPVAETVAAPEVVAE